MNVRKNGLFSRKAVDPELLLGSRHSIICTIIFKISAENRQPSPFDSFLLTFYWDSSHPLQERRLVQSVTREGRLPHQQLNRHWAVTANRHVCKSRTGSTSNVKAPRNRRDGGLKLCRHPQRKPVTDCHNWLIPSCRESQFPDDWDASTTKKERSWTLWLIVHYVAHETCSTEQ